MCYVIVTARSLLWTLLTVVATMAILSAILTPKWLIGPPRLKPSGRKFIITATMTELLILLYVVHHKFKFVRMIAVFARQF
jgi:hypothetical protein